MFKKKFIPFLNLQILLKRGTTDLNQKTSPSLELRQTVLKLTQNNEYCYLMNDADLNSTLCKKNFCNPTFLFPLIRIFFTVGSPFYPYFERTVS
jgi:hypothetical protein